MGWAVSIQDGMEIDRYDALRPYYMLIRSTEMQICGCWRLLPTQGPYMLRDTFPQLLHGQAAPRHEHIWELSRFAIETDGPKGFGFADLALDAMRQAVAFGDRMGISHYVTVTTLGIERLLIKTGIAVNRFGPPLRVGVEQAVALEIDIGAQTRAALFDQIGPAA
jgi:acyl homoserine lactone synthase